MDPKLFTRLSFIDTLGDPVCFLHDGDWPSLHDEALRICAKRMQIVTLHENAQPSVRHSFNMSLQADISALFTLCRQCKALDTVANDKNPLLRIDLDYLGHKRTESGRQCPVYLLTCNNTSSYLLVYGIEQFDNTTRTAYLLYADAELTHIMSATDAPGDGLQQIVAQTGRIDMSDGRTEYFGVTGLSSHVKWSDAV